MSERFDTPEAMLAAMQESPCGHYWHKARPMVERLVAAEREASELRERNEKLTEALRGLLVVRSVAGDGFTDNTATLQAITNARAALSTGGGHS